MFDESDDFSSDSERGADSGDDWVPGDDIIHKEVNIEGRPAGDIVNDDEDADQAEEEDDEDAEELEDAFFENQLDPMSLLESMGKQEAGSQAPAAAQPYQILTKTARQARVQTVKPRRRTRQREDPSSTDEEKPQKERKGAKRGRPPQSGATVDDIWGEDDGEGFEKARKGMKVRAKRRRKAAAAGKKAKELPEEVTRKQGEANLLYATGKFQQALPLLQDVIQAAPNLADPYKTMGLCYEQIGNSRKALDFYMITAHMTPKDIALWKRLAALSTEMGFNRQAIYCLSKVIRRDKNDADAWFDRSLLYVELGETKKACLGFEKVQSLRPGDTEVPMMLARIYHNLEQPQKAITVLEAHLRKYPLATDPTHVNILAELYMDSQQHQKAVQLIQRAAEHVCKSGLPIDLQTKLGICLLQVSLIDEALEQLQVLFQDPIETDLCLDAADALYQCDRPAEALKLYERANCEDQQNNGLWAKLANCYAKLDKLSAAVDIYVSVANGSNLPIDTRREAAISLAELLCEKKMKHQTMSALRHLDKIGVKNMGFLHRKCQVLLDLGDEGGYLDTVLPVIKETISLASQKKTKQTKKSALDKEAERRKKILLRINKAKQEGAIFKGFVSKDRRTQHRIEADEKLAQMLAEQNVSLDEAPAEVEEEANALLLRDLARNEQDLQAVLTTARVMIEIDEPHEASELLADCITHLTKRWHDRASKEKRDTLRLAAAQAAIAACEPALAIHHLRHVCITWPHSAAVWNLLCQATIAAPAMIRQAHHTIAVLALEDKENLAMRLVNGHCHASDGAYGNALTEYMAGYNSHPEEPLCLLCVGVTHLNQAVTRKVPNRDAAVLAAFAFLQTYSQKRENKQEAYYNLGRAAHQLGLMHLAVSWYHRSLEAPVPTPWTDPSSGRAPVSIDLSREIAYNLALVYRSSGAHQLARDILRKHLTI